MINEGELTVAVLMHDGFYGCGTGAGHANRRLLELLIAQTPADTRFIVMPVRLRPSSAEYDPDWHRGTEAILHRGRCTVEPLDNGTNGWSRFGGLPAFKRLCANAGDTVNRYGFAERRMRVLALDVPFLGLGEVLNAELRRQLILLPRSTAKIHAPDDGERIRWEANGLHTSVRGGARVAAISAYMRRHLVDDYSIDERHIVDLFDGVTAADWTPQEPDTSILPAPARDGFLLSMGRATAYKGFDDLLDALVLLRNQNAAVPHTVVAAVTDGDEINDYQRHLATRISSEDLDVTLLTSFQPGIRSLLWHRAVRAVVVPSRAEPFGRVPLEAHVAGAAPVVVTSAGGLADQVVDGKTGFTAIPGDPSSLATALRRAMAVGPAARKLMRHRARADIQQRFNHADFVTQFLTNLT